MEDDTYIHFEFHTTNKNTTDLRRFRAYEALLSHQTGKDVITYVVYSGNIINAFANKFLRGKDLDRVKEELKLTELIRKVINQN